MFSFFSLPIIFPLLKPGFFTTHDGEWAVIRLAEMDRELRDGQFPPRWSDYLNHGYGYPLFNFTYPFPYFMAEIFNLLGFGLVNSIKIVFILSVLFSGLFMYLLGEKIWGKLGGFLCSIFYLYFPFRFVDLYVRGSIGESLSLALFPLIFYLTLSWIENFNMKNLALVSIFLSCLILTHNVISLIFVPIWFLFLVIILLFKKKNSSFIIYRALFIIVSAFFPSALFWLPAIVEKKYISLSVIPLADKTKHFVMPWQLLSSLWTYEELPSFQIGWFHIITFLLAALTALWLWGEKRINVTERAIVLYCCITTVVLILLLFPASYPFWQAIPLLREIDFPWRVLGIIGFFITLPLGVLKMVSKSIFPIVFIIILVAFINSKYARPKEFISRSNSLYATNDATTTSADELMPIWVFEKPRERPRQKIEVIDGKANIKNLFYNSKKISFEIEAETKAIIQLNTIYFPGWKIFADGKELAINFDNPRGLIIFNLDKGTHKVKGTFTNTPIRILANIISLLGLFFVGGLFFRKKEGIL